MWTVAKGPISVFFILNFLLPEEQGLWYTFISLGALKVFAELGFTSIITQFVSHEYANVQENRKLIIGDYESVNRFFSLIRYSIKLYLIIVPLAISLMIIIGLFYFKSNDLNTILAWCFYSLIGGISLLLSLFQSIYKGLDKVKLVQQNLFFGSLLLGIGNWLFLYLDFKIWALVLGNILGFITMIYHLYKIAPSFWQQVINHNNSLKISWGKEILSLQWKYAISWASGYFIFSLIIPILYKYENPVLAGKYGITFTIISACVGISQAWVISKIPKFNMLVAKKELNELNKFFKTSFLHSILIQIAISFILLAAFALMDRFEIFDNRFLDLKYIFLLLLIQIPIQTANFLAIYLRAFKKEPFIFYSIINAILIVLSLYILLPEYGFHYLILSITLIYWFILLPYAVILFVKKKKLFLKNLLSK